MKRGKLNLRISLRLLSVKAQLRLICVKVSSRAGSAEPFEKSYLASG